MTTIKELIPTFYPPNDPNTRLYKDLGKLKDGDYMAGLILSVQNANNLPDRVAKATNIAVRELRPLKGQSVEKFYFLKLNDLGNEPGVKRIVEMAEDPIFCIRKLFQ